MVSTKKLFFSIKKATNFFVGVPDSVLKNFLVYLDNNKKNIKNLVAANEGSAIGIGIGHYLSTKKIPCIYLQNSGLGNSINPLISIAHKKIYSIPLLLLIGWRGSPNTPDEPQHVIKGKITTDILKILGIKYIVLNSDKDIKKINSLVDLAYKKKVPVAILVKKKSLSKTYPASNPRKKFIKNKLIRSEFIKHLLLNIKKNDKIISTTGYTSRELFQLRKLLKLENGKDFYMVGGMGHALSVAQGVALSSNKSIICLDGDGSLLMHLGSMHTAGVIKKGNLKHILLNNSCHESVGGQPTYADKINFKNLALSLGYTSYFLLSKKQNIYKIFKKFMSSKGPALLEVKISEGILKNLERPKNFNIIKRKFIDA